VGSSILKPKDWERILEKMRANEGQCLPVRKAILDSFLVIMASRKYCSPSVNGARAFSS
jgi:hypothetical protein